MGQSDPQRTLFYQLAGDVCPSRASSAGDPPACRRPGDPPRVSRPLFADRPALDSAGAAVFGAGGRLPAGHHQRAEARDGVAPVAVCARSSSISSPIGYARKSITAGTESGVGGVLRCRRSARWADYPAGPWGDSVSAAEARPVALCPICEFNDVYAGSGEPVPATCDDCAREQASKRVECSDSD